MTTTRGTFTGITVQTGTGGGLATPPVLATDRTSHFHAANLPDLGDSVLVVTRVLDPVTGAPLTLELRAFSAHAPRRSALPTLPADELLSTAGAIAFAEVELAEAGDSPDERRAATLTRCTVSDAAPTEAAARHAANWLRTTWESELAFGSWPAIRGTVTSIATGSRAADWAATWLADSEHHVGDDGLFLKVFSAAWLDPISEVTR